MDMDISMDIHGKSVDMDMDMDGKFHIHGKPDKPALSAAARSPERVHCEQMADYSTLRRGSVECTTFWPIKSVLVPGVTSC